jgi:hypothetical protein
MRLQTFAGTPVTPVAMLEYPSHRSYDSSVYNFTFGYGDESDDGSGTGCAGSTMPPCHGTQAFSTAFLHGNYTHADGATTWSPSGSKDLPCSLYLASKPAWWGALPFPATGPDVTGGSGPAGHSYGNAAKACYEGKMGGTLGGAGGPLSFNAKACYGP